MEEPRLTLAIAKTEALCVEMPMLFKDVAKAPEYFGGMQNLSTIQETKTPFLPIKLRPGEPNCKPIFADRAKTQTFVLKVTKKRPHEPCTAAITAIATEKFVCEGMADFQYLAAPRYLESMAEPMTKKLLLYRNISTANELELVPEVFSRVDLPLRYEFKQRPKFKEREPGDEASPATKVTGRGVQYVNFRTDKVVPQFQGPQSMPKTRGIPAELEEQVLTFLRQKLDERPIWHRHKLFENVSAAERRVALRFLPLMCYIFLSGPWRGMWVRMGYDPRTTPSSALYQMLEIRGNRELVLSTVSMRTQKKISRNKFTSRLSTVIQSMDAEDDVALHFKQKKRHNRSKSTVKTAPLAELDDEAPTYLIYGIPLSTGYFHIQLCDLRENNPSIDAAMTPFDSRMRQSASILSGWYPSCMFAMLREMLRFHIATVVGRPAEELAMRQKHIRALERAMLNDLAARGDVDSDDNTKRPSSTTGDDGDAPADEATADEATADEANSGDDDDGDDDEDEDDDDDDEEESKQDDSVSTVIAL
ncbi:hypothetical protein SPRG_19596 [Saprolegnia parasitica CBS 223.65]|uniref:Transcription factor IIIC subunit 5 HTH domain-containing protein n=1 Tax=Saprolegnia parasitica (strain CBS 223.65) TaxID=695850 RepID=A0A067CKL7_SAPPC|nr:hypothetical protein SPRG_19596 [Saprolegnia parasitica CBS 223.65]KDO31073.1 hypothetical protein SPRG_19596 [Saprolegnia parasitica CBS 223.65]|eukprot:XP_012198328.1 hypothetical protein SPRG_19596 [Saprolegnia parasitica CBS 223.65]